MIVSITTINLILLWWSLAEVTQNAASIYFVFLSFWSAVWLAFCTVRGLSNFILSDFGRCEVGSVRGNSIKDPKAAAFVWGRTLTADRKRSEWGRNASVNINYYRAVNFGTVPKSCWF